MATPENISIFTGYIVLVVLQVLGIGVTAWTLFAPGGGELAKRARTRLLEKDGPSAGSVSFSRVAGTLGALTLASLFVATVFWAQYALYSDASLDEAKKLWPVYLLGSALFAPYAFNRLAQLIPGSNQSPTPPNPVNALDPPPPD